MFQQIIKKKYALARQHQRDNLENDVVVPISFPHWWSLTLTLLAAIVGTLVTFNRQHGLLSRHGNMAEKTIDHPSVRARRAFDVTTATVCAKERSSCTCTGEVRFGNELKDTWSTTHAMSMTSISCEDATFGNENPVPDDARVCQCSPFVTADATTLTAAQTLTAKARTYQLGGGTGVQANAHSVWKPYHFTYWSQQVGQSYTEYWRDMPCSASDQLNYCAVSSELDENTRAPHICGQIPKGRIHSDAVVYGSQVSGQPIQSYMLVFGGNNGATMGDTWVFANGLINGESWDPKMKTYDPADLYQSQCEETSVDGCNSCNRWHHIHADAVPREVTSCLFEGVCTHESYGVTNATLKSFAVEGHTMTLMANTSNQLNGAALMFGGERKNHGYSSEVWYLSKLPVPIVGASEAGYGLSFPPSFSSEWRCAAVYGHEETFPPVTNCMGENPSSSDITEASLITSSGTVRSGRLYPATRCYWTIAPTDFNSNTHALLLSINVLDLAEDECTSTVSITDGNGTLLVRGCNRNKLAATKYVTLVTPVQISLDYHSECPHHGGMSISYNVVSLEDDSLRCKEGCSGRGRCQGGECVCDHGRTGTLCEEDCPLLGACPFSHAFSSAVSFPPPRRAHTMIASYHQSISEVLKSEYSSPSSLTEYQSMGLTTQTINETVVTTTSKGLLRHIMFGGFSSTALADLWMLDMLEQVVGTGGTSGIINRWTQLFVGGGPSARFGHTAVLVGTVHQPSYSMIVYGGQNQLQTFGDVYVLRLVEDSSAYSWEALVSSTPSPPNRTQHAASRFTSDDGTMKMAIYGGRHGDTIHSDLWLLPINTDGTVGSWVAHSGIHSRGTFLQSSLVWPDFWPSTAKFFTDMGFQVASKTAQSLPARFGHLMKTITSTASLDTWSKGGLGGIKQALLSFSGSSSTDIVSSRTHSVAGIIKSTDGGKNPFLYHLCPEVDMICANPSYKGQQ